MGHCTGGEAVAIGDWMNTVSHKIYMEAESEKEI